MNEETQRVIAEVAALLSDARRVAVLTGAGASAESGVATFRDAQTGLWSRFDAQRLASQDGFRDDPGLVWGWYMHRLAMVEVAEPNPGHHALAALAGEVDTLTLITQNVDDLHERAGSPQVLHLHGHIARFHCNECGAAYYLQPEDRVASLPPVCHLCNGYVRPSVVWFGEMLPDRVLTAAWRAAEQCDVFLVVGTSGIVYPAAQLPIVAHNHGAQVVEINTEPSMLSESVDYVLLGPSGQILPDVLAEVRSRRS